MTEMSGGATYYDVLGVEPNAPVGKIKALYRLKSRQAHPDRSNGDAEWQKQLNGAYEILSDPASRSAYNESLGLPTKPRSPKPGQPIYAEIHADNHVAACQVPYSFTRWEPCGRCWGQGCPYCQGKGKTRQQIELRVTVPAGVSQVVVRGQGAQLEPGGKRGDLILYVIKA